MHSKWSGEALVLDLKLSAASPETYALQFSSARIADSDYRDSIKIRRFNSNTSAFKVVRDKELSEHFSSETTMWTGRKWSDYPVLVRVMIIWILLRLQHRIHGLSESDGSRTVRPEYNVQYKGI